MLQYNASLNDVLGQQGLLTNVHCNVFSRETYTVKFESTVAHLYSMYSVTMGREPEDSRGRDISVRYYAYASPSDVKASALSYECGVRTSYTTT